MDIGSNDQQYSNGTIRLTKLLSTINDFKVQNISNTPAQPLVGEAVRSESFEELGEHHLNNRQQTCHVFEQKTEHYSRRAERKAQATF